MSAWEEDFTPTDLVSKELLSGRHELVHIDSNTERRAHICKPCSASTFLENATKINFMAAVV